VHKAPGTSLSPARRFQYTVLMLFFCIVSPGLADADELNGFMEWDYSNLNLKSTDATGGVMNTKSTTFNQKYNIMLNKNILPLLRLNAGYLFESDQNMTTSNGMDSDSKITTTLPSLDLSLGNPMLNSSIGYSKRKENDSISGSSSLSRYNEDYHGTFGWRPEGLPALNLLVERINTFDSPKVTEDTTNDRLSFGASYIPVKNLDLKYLFNYNDLLDRINSLDVTQVTHNGRMSYSGQFLAERVSFYSSYNITQQTTTTNSNGGKGVVDFQLNSFAGLFALNFTPNVGALAQYPTLIDGNLTTSSGINIGPMLPPQSARNMGIDLLNPQTVNRILVWVDRKLPDRIAQLFTWDVYTSQDNQIWTKIFSVNNLVQDPFQNRFEIKFIPQQVTTRYIKVVVTPLDQNTVQALAIPGFLPPFDVFVTEIQAFDERPASAVQGKNGTLSHILNTDVKVRLLDAPNLYYESSLFYTSSSGGNLNSFSRYTLSNALLTDYLFSEAVSTSARVAREDSEETLGHRSAYVYTASLRFTPFRTLSNSLIYSGRTETFQGKMNDTNSLFLNSTAELYHGVNINANGGASFATLDTGEKTKTYNALLGVNIVPRRDLNLNTSYTFSKTDLSGGSQGNSTITSQRGDFGVTYRPFSTLYFSTSLGVLEQTGRKTDIFQNYGVNWSPFPDGALQFTTTYSENLRTFNQERSRLISPTMTWKITARTILDMSFPILKTESLSGKTDSKTFSTILRTSF
jgi:hypothetical protein